MTSGGLLLGLGLMNLTADPRVEDIRTAAEQTIPSNEVSGLRRLAPAVEPTQTTGFEFLFVDSAGKPTGLFSPCEPIEYQIDTTNEPQGSRDLLDLAIRDLEKATGLVFEFAGEIKLDVLSDPDQLQEDGPVRIVYLPNNEFNELRSLEGDTNPDEPLAFAGPRVLFLNPEADQSRAVGGRAVFDTSWMLTELDGGWDGRDPRSTTIYQTFVHELAHVLGLAHVDDETELMYPVQSPANASGLGPGDLSGLALAGQGACGVDEEGNLVFPTN